MNEKTKLREDWQVPEKKPRSREVESPKLEDVLRQMLARPPQPRKRKIKEEKPEK